MGLYSVILENVKVLKKKKTPFIKTYHEPYKSNVCDSHTLILLVALSEWSEWTSCSPCVPASSLLHSDSAMGDGEDVNGGLGMPESALVSVQRRYRACLDVDSGLPVGEREEECSKPLQEERICPLPDVCKGDHHSQRSNS